MKQRRKEQLIIVGALILAGLAILASYMFSNTRSIDNFIRPDDNLTISAITLDSGVEGSVRIDEELLTKQPAIIQEFIQQRYDAYETSLQDFVEQGNDVSESELTVLIHTGASIGDMAMTTITIEEKLDNKQRPISVESFTFDANGELFSQKTLSEDLF